MSTTARLIKLRNIKRALRLEPNEAINYVINGRVGKFRPYKSKSFIDLVDGSTRDHLQLVVSRDLLDKPELGSYLSCQGNVVKSLGDKQPIEFKVNKLNYLGKCDPEEYPLATANMTSDTLTDGWYRNHLHLRPRAPHFASLLRLRSELELSFHMILKQMDFFRVHTPTLTGNDSEASTDLFAARRHRLSSSVYPDSDASFFQREVYMNSSAQLHLECLAASLNRVYSLSNCFRAENSQTPRHLCEFLMLEAEETDVTELAPLMDRVESIIKFVCQYLQEISEFKSDLACLLDRYSNHETFEKLAHSEYIRMTYNEALDILNRIQSNQKITSDDSTATATTTTRKELNYGCDIGRSHERLLLDHCNNVPIFITNYPSKLKPFYMKCDNGGGVDEATAADADDDCQSGRRALCFDLIAPFGGEICGGSLREDNLDRLSFRTQQARQQQQQQQQLKHFDWYLELRKFGSFPHGGFGLGFERLLQSMLGVRNIRDSLAFPRWPGNCLM